ncbi:succinate dehydrogenase, cytochrome b556 subunit [Candidatus Falkowbacteria bacterium RIFCSPLOWO2_12_FULL_45_13]|uniref:Succinate dehydrogenase, cytochrome b556 subunit n=2 Tax=Bacteria TaxID=2 RepID=A0A1F4RDU2_UNCSA|nr:MAG: succinate dehydrogenase, cytochrome b556 subunit [candidate division WOR-1 bacterium RIFCSPLOWO2_02_FULL_46_20]OGF32024.1 MAG: succinate dehydrogenase, cytochrome b556 subunit [Candidatus Falkowbacteria bacterium RIFCSPLOWO2_12_FULL_45_13]
MLNNLKKESILACQSGVGMWAFLLHRLTGLALIFYLLMHIMVISTSLRGPHAFNQLLAVLTSQPFIIADLGLLAAVLFHGLNGIRILFFDLGVGIRIQKIIFWAVIAAAALIWGVTLYLTLPFIMGK